MVARSDLGALVILPPAPRVYKQPTFTSTLLSSSLLQHQLHTAPPPPLLPLPLPVFCLFLTLSHHTMAPVLKRKDRTPLAGRAAKGQTKMTRVVCLRCSKRFARQNGVVHCSRKTPSQNCRYCNKQHGRCLKVSELQPLSSPGCSRLSPASETLTNWVQHRCPRSFEASSTSSTLRPLLLWLPAL